ncbi:response regulator transcription factor [Derxia lacustris]|uniref:response regulator transcription factor n=1 Tax=Derxia lacustris TaxID=764842 RepID=UPI000A177C66|nr:response regulator transcription factor [Derxia lacustris]
MNAARSALARDSALPALHRSRVLIAHASPLLAAGLQAALAPEFELIDTPPAGLCASAADVVIVDEHGAADWSAARCAGAAQAPRCLVVSRDLRGASVRRALERGAHGYVGMDSALADIAHAVHSLCQGRRYLCATASLHIADSFADDALTPRELEVLELICAGLCNKSIGLRLGIALGTVKAHVRTVLAKLGVASRTQAIATAQRRGLLPDDELAEAAQGADAAAADPAPRPRARPAKPPGRPLSPSAASAAPRRPSPACARASAR